MSDEKNTFGPMPDCPECGLPVDEVDGRRGGWRRVHTRCAGRRRERLRDLRRGKRMNEEADRIAEARKLLADNARRLRHEIRMANKESLEADRLTLEWIKSDIRLTARWMNTDPELLDRAFRTDHGPGQRADPENGPRTGTGPAAEGRTQDGPDRYRSSQTGPDQNGPQRDRTPNGPRPARTAPPAPSEQTGTGPASDRYRFGPDPAMIMGELGLDAVDRIADLVGWRRYRPWLDGDLAREGTLPETFLGILPDPGERTDFSTWTYDLDQTPPPIDLMRIIDAMWTQDAQDPTISPDRLRPYKPE